MTSSVEYATRLMVALARVHGRSPLTADKLVESENISLDYVNQILLRLRRGGLIESHRGTGGGYAIARDPAQITLAQVVRAVEGKIFENVCEKYDGGVRDCRQQGHCGIAPVWQRLGLLIENYFDGVTIARLLAESPSACGKV